MKLKEISLNLFLILFSIYTPLFIFCLFEYYRPNNFGRIKFQRIISEDISQKIEAINSNLSPTYYPSEQLNLRNAPKNYPIGSIPLTKSYLCNEGYGLIKYKTDRFGLRNLNSKWADILEKSNIFLIGDSFVHGHCVKEYSTFSSNIQRKTNINTLNLGSGGNSPYEYMAIMKSIVQPILEKSKKNNIVALIFYANDRNFKKDNKREALLNEINPIFKFSSGNIVVKDSYISNINNLVKNNYPNTKKEMISEIKNDLFKKTSIYQISTLVYFRSSIKSILKSTKSKNTNQISTSEKTIYMLSEVCDKNCIPLVVFIPSKEPNSKESLYRKDLNEITKRLNISFINGESVIESDNRRDYAPKGGHFSISGYKKLSELIVENIYLKTN